jgi:predicted dithiol-disulfide oxidoreductase (DUF899 family)
MFGPDYTAGCPACSAIADGFNGIAIQLANHDVMLWAVSRALLTKRSRKRRQHVRQDERHRSRPLHPRSSWHERLRLEDGAIYHTYSAYARGLDALWSMYQWLDRAPKGRNETTSGFPATTNILEL